MVESIHEFFDKGANSESYDSRENEGVGSYLEGPAVNHFDTMLPGQAITISIISQLQKNPDGLVINLDNIQFALSERKISSERLMSVLDSLVNEGKVIRIHDLHKLSYIFEG